MIPLLCLYQKKGYTNGSKENKKIINNSHNKVNILP